MSATFSIQAPRGVAFAKRVKPANSGRKKGVPNVATRDVKQAILMAAERVGGAARLAEWIKEDARNEHSFWVHIWPRLLPVFLQGSGPGGEIELAMKIKPEELLAKLKERNLPTNLFGDQKPLLELTARKDAGDHSLTNGRGNGADCVVGAGPRELLED
jgi:hypothetical protein